MSIARQDAWSQDEDLLLAEVVLRHIREGSTQLKAFEEVGKKLSRTSAACGFRWNSYVRKQYKSGIELAKKQRKQSKKKNLEAPVQAAVQIQLEKHNHPPEETAMPARPGFLQDPPANLHDVIQFLVQYDQDYGSGAENDNIKQELAALKADYENVVNINKQLQEKLQTVEEDYRALIGIMERARKLIFLEEESKDSNVRFQMDKNGNLERVKK
ncbi:RsfA family transcriptional regulator [Peribacillus kribbensis]|uniref:RsfA family transcriptional regulator n=1 Tax=Peribacillus kribbensis TaxID=356658 RepID=UPI00047D618F|nr:RsfA family transcriptional regulator [Peribacillus kribbensis]